MQNFFSIFLLTCLGPLSLLAQSPLNEHNREEVLAPNIKTVRFLQEDNLLDYPVVELNSPQRLVLSFDDLDGDAKNYFYKVIHCNSDWTPSEQFSAIDYIDGFEEGRIFDWQSSAGVRGPSYTHYRLTLPNDDLRWTKSGNYILKVYEDGDESKLIFTRRFMVFERIFKPALTLRRSATPPYSATHHELMLKIQHGGFSIQNPATDVRVAILQNGRWDNAIYNPEANQYARDHINYDWQGRLVFEAGKDFRPLDLRSINYRSLQMQTLIVEGQRIETDLFIDQGRASSPNNSIDDINGNFIVQTHDFQDVNLQGSYLTVHFRLDAPKRTDGDYYIFGGLTDWQPNSDYRLRYDEEEGRYRATVQLKNGFYNYYYAFFPDYSSGLTYRADISHIEGNSYESENNYLVLVYYRPFGSRYEQLAGIGRMNSHPR